MKKILFLLLALIFPFSVFAQDIQKTESEENTTIYGCTQL